MEWMLRDNARPGTAINELELARQLRCRDHRHPRVSEPLSALRPDREASERRLGVQGLHPGLRTRTLRDPRDVRAAFSARLCRRCRQTRPSGSQIETLREEHLALLREIDERFHDFSDLDSRFHRLINSAAPNRFIDDFYDIITLIFHYHYQWNKHDERQRNEVAIREHLTYIDALLSRDASMVEIACRAHLTSAKETLIRSTSG